MVTLLTFKQEVRGLNTGAAPPKSLEPIPLPTTPRVPERDGVRERRAPGMTKKMTRLLLVGPNHGRDRGIHHFYQDSSSFVRTISFSSRRSLNKVCCHLHLCWNCTCKVKNNCTSPNNIFASFYKILQKFTNISLMRRKVHQCTLYKH